MSVEEIKDQMRQFFAQKTNKVQEKAKQLREEGEEELACLELEKIRVYDIFERMLDSSAASALTNPKYAGLDEVRAFTQEYLMTFIMKPSSEWRMRLAAAIGMRDWEEMTIGEIKLATVLEIKGGFLKIVQKRD